MRYIDSSRIAADWICPKSRWWGYEFEGRGLSAVEPNPDLQFGLAVAEQVDRLRRTGESSASPPILDDHVLMHGLLEAYRQHIWPAWQLAYELVGTEIECTRPLAPDLTYMARPDAVLRRRLDGTVWVLSDKTTSLDPQRFTQLWDKAVQNHAECICVEETLGLQVAGFYTQGWVKGYKKNNTIYSPLCFAWCKENISGLTRDQWSPIYKSGWTRRRVDAYMGGLGAWVQSLPKELVLEQFPVAGPIMLRRDLVRDYFAQIVEGETGARHYPKHFTNCDEYGKYRRPCEFKACCWVPTVGRDPLGSGLYRRRDPHHAVERTVYGD